MLKRPDREPSWARSGQEAERTVKCIAGRPCFRMRCEPRTARGPGIVPSISYEQTRICWKLSQDEA